MKLGFKTTLGVVIAAVGALSKDVGFLAAIGPVASHVITVGGTILTVLGLRDAVAKNGDGK